MKEVILKRLKTIINANKDVRLQEIEKKLCKANILYFFDTYLYTDRNKTIYWDEYPDILPFLLYEFQKEYVNEVWESIIEWNKPIHERNPDILTNIFVEKSRQMWISWVTAWIFLYGFLFHKHKYTIISRIADEVDKSWDMDSMFEKLRFMIRNLPDWMLPKWFSKEQGKDKTNAYMNITDPEWTASITWKTANPDAGRWWTRNAIFMDEMATMAYAHEIDMAAGSNTPCRIYNSTPNGEWNEFYRKRKLAMPSKDEYGNIKKPEIKWLRYHRKDHPLYDEAWYAWKIKGMSKEEIARELEINYNVSIKWRVYPEFNVESEKLEYDITKPLYIALDNSHWWLDPNAIIVMQPEDQYMNIIDSIELFITPQNCAEFLSGQPRFELTDSQLRFLERYKKYNWQKAVFIADPYDTMSAMGNSTLLEDYRKVGINLFIPNERNKERQISKTRTNIYRVRYNDYCLDFASAIMNSRYPEVRESSQWTTPHLLPVHNQFSHYRTALEYMVNYYLENQIPNKKRIAEDTRLVRNMITWKLTLRPQPQRLSRNYVSWVLR